MKYVITELPPRTTAGKDRRSVKVAAVSKMEDAVVMAAALAKDRVMHILCGDLDSNSAEGSTRSIHVNAYRGAHQEFGVACFLCSTRSELFDVISPIDLGRIRLKKWKEDGQRAKRRKEFLMLYWSQPAFRDGAFFDRFREAIYRDGELTAALDREDWNAAEVRLAELEFPKAMEAHAA